MRNRLPPAPHDSRGVEGEGLAIVAILVGLLLTAGSLLRLHPVFDAVVEAIPARALLGTGETLLLGLGLLAAGAVYLFLHPADDPADDE